MFSYEVPDEDTEIGSWSSPESDDEALVFSNLVFHRTSDPETAARWRAELSTGRFPENTDDVS